MKTVFVKCFQGNTLCLNLESNVPYSTLVGSVLQSVSFFEGGVPVNDIILFSNGKLLLSSSSSSRPEEQNPMFINATLRICGGKQGAFGQNLRRAGRRVKKTTNFDACRTLDGRKVRQVKQEEQLAKWKEEQVLRREREIDEEKKKAEKKKEKVQEVISKVLERVDRNAVNIMTDAVREGLKAKRQREGKEKEKEEKKQRRTDWDLKFDEENDEIQEEEDTKECTERREKVRLNGKKFERVMNPYGHENTWECDGCGKQGKGFVMHCSVENGVDLCSLCYEQALRCEESTSQTTQAPNPISN